MRDTTQVSLFPSDSAPTQSVVEEKKDPLRVATEFTLEWAATTQGSATEYLKAMEERFGSMIRMYIVEIISELTNRKDIRLSLREYLTQTLSETEIATALGERHGRPKEMPSLDELFGRSRELQTTQKYVEAVSFCSKLTSYSPYNNMLVYVQNPEATFWATASHWKKAFRRAVKVDARPMLILAPMTPVLLVYDVVDTEGSDLPSWFMDPFTVSGGVSEDVLTKTLANAQRDRIQVVHKKMGLLHGGTAMIPPNAATTKVRIELKEGEPKATTYATLCHELAHVYLGHLGGDVDGWWVSRLGLPRTVRELEAESVAWLVCQRAGISTKSAEYLAGYLSNPEDQKLVSLDMVAKAASRIEEMGRRTLAPRKTKAEKKASR